MTRTEDTHEDWPEGLPIEYPGLSFWLTTTRGFPYLAEGADSPLPERAATVVIGSGLAGSLATYHLLAAGEKDIVMLEARDAASCASARNGGHVRPNPFYGFPRYAALHGVEQAVKIIKNERVVLKEVVKFVQEHEARGVDCDLEQLSSFHTILNDAFASDTVRAYEEYKGAGGPVNHIKQYTGADVAKVTRVPQAVAAWEFPAASVHPAKLCQFFITSNIKNGLRLFTHTPCIGVEPASDDSGRWVLRTPRGKIVADRVLHATNAFAPVLLPELKGCIVPNKAQCLSLIPTPAYAGPRRLAHTQAYLHGPSHSWYSVQRKQDGVIILGIFRENSEIDEETKRLIIEERAIDKRPLPGMVKASLDAWHSLHPDFGRPERLVPGEGLQLAWSGVIGTALEGVPFIGEVPGKLGQWICAGFGGHGMARIWTAAPGIAMLMNGAPWEDTGLPECFNLTPERLARVQRLAST
ncbi:FAD dependent oxidoreductase [Auricularia subglabra TFB-10046 SS5]|nr:FAD dependent oxidoreductase [Auricularia subglabra TFB-10046 SS5]